MIRTFLLPVSISQVASAGPQGLRRQRTREPLRSGTPEIAKALPAPEATLAQRLVRGKREIQEARIPYEVPQPEKLPERLGPVRAVIYLIFNEGYSAMAGDQLVCNDLCREPSGWAGCCANCSQGAPRTWAFCR